MYRMRCLYKGGDLWYTFFMQEKALQENSRGDDLALWASFCLFLSAVEYAVPKPLPFMRLGLANLPIILSLKKFPLRKIYALAALKVLGQALISGTLFSYVILFSAAGTFASVLFMTAFSALGEKNVSFLGLSLIGAFSNNMAQLICARLIMFGESTRYIAPPLLACGLVTGFFLGLFALAFEEKSVWYRQCGDCGEKKFQLNLKRESRLGCGFSLSARKISFSFPALRFCLCMISMVVFLFIKTLWIKWTFTGVFFILAEIKKKGKVNILSALFITLGVCFFALLVPHGKVLLSIGSWRITQGALTAGLYKSAGLIGMVFISQTAVDRNLLLPGKAGTLVTRTLACFETLTSMRIRFRKGSIIESLDSAVLNAQKELWGAEMSADLGADAADKI